MLFDLGPNSWNVRRDWPQYQQNVARLGQCPGS